MNNFSFLFADLYHVDLCVYEGGNKSYEITWRTPPALADATCEIGRWPKDDPSQAETIFYQPSNGSLPIDVTVLYVVMVTCQLKVDGMSNEKEYRQNLTFLPGKASIRNGSNNCR